MSQKKEGRKGVSKLQPFDVTSLVEIYIAPQVVKPSLLHKDATDLLAVTLMCVELLHHFPLIYST